MIPVRWTPQSSSDLEQIFQHLEFEAGSAIAFSQTSKIFEAVYFLRQYPNAGRSAHPLRGRVLPVKGAPFLVYYGVQGEVLKVITVRHGARKPLRRLKLV